MTRLLPISEPHQAGTKIAARTTVVVAADGQASA
jgi:hypothetical protein